MSGPSTARAGTLARLSGGPKLVTQRLILRPPRRGDANAWIGLRRASYAFLKPWEPSWSDDHLSPSAFRRRVSWSRREIAQGRSYPFLIFAGGAAPAHDGLVGAVTLEHVRRGAAMSAALGYWLGEPYTGMGYMAEALEAVIAFAFDDLDLSRMEAACLPENFPSRRLLERCGFHEEGLAMAYLQINGAWRDHLIYERRRSDRQ